MAVGRRSKCAPICAIWIAMRCPLQVPYASTLDAKMPNLQSALILPNCMRRFYRPYVVIINHLYTYSLLLTYIMTTTTSATIKSTITSKLNQSQAHSTSKMASISLHDYKHGLLLSLCTFFNTLACRHCFLPTMTHRDTRIWHLSCDPTGRQRKSHFALASFH